MREFPLLFTNGRMPLSGKEKFWIFKGFDGKDWNYLFSQLDWEFWFWFDERYFLHVKEAIVTPVQYRKKKEWMSKKLLGK